MRDCNLRQRGRAPSSLCRVRRTRRRQGGHYACLNESPWSRCTNWRRVMVVERTKRRGMTDTACSRKKHSLCRAPYLSHERTVFAPSESAKVKSKLISKSQMASWPLAVERLRSTTMRNLCQRSGICGTTLKRSNVNFGRVPLANFPF